MFNDPWRVENKGNSLMRSEWLAPSLVKLVETAPDRVLDIGCATGISLTAIAETLDESTLLVGADVDLRALNIASCQIASGRMVASDGTKLPFRSGVFDVIFMATYMSSVPKGAQSLAAAEAARVLSPSGIILWYDARYPNPLNPSLTPVSRRRIHQLFPGFLASIEPITFVPQLTRRLGDATYRVYPTLNRMRPLRTHYRAVLQKPP